MAPLPLTPSGYAPDQSDFQNLVVNFLSKILHPW